MKQAGEITGLVEQTLFVDTHEHLWEEAHRLEAQRGERTDVPAPDFSLLFGGYCEADLAVAGMADEARKRFDSPELSPLEKWKLLEPFYARARNTGYLQAVRESVQALYGEEDICEGNCEAISEQVRAGIGPGFYRRILRDAAGVEYCQIDSIHTTPIFRADAPDPAFLAQDLNTVALCAEPQVEKLSEWAGQTVSGLKDWHAVIDWAFATYGPRAVATKNQAAYGRALDYEKVTTEEAAPLFARFLQDRKGLDAPEWKALQDHLFHYCVRQAVAQDLPIKLHTGYYAGHNGMPFGRVRNNVADLCPILREHLDARFDLFHITYPYQDEVIALAKHYANAYVDMCWAWIINPYACVRFVKEFLAAAPASKLFTFGGDFRCVEHVPGHARMARRGLAQAISELHAEGWLLAREVPGLVERLMRGNAHEVFPYERAVAHWSRAAQPRQGSA